MTASERYLENTTQCLSELGSSLSVKQYPGNLFISIAGTVGKPIITKIKCCIHDGFVWFPDLKINKEFLYYLFSSGQLYKGLGKWGTQLNLNTETIGDIHFSLPSTAEIDTIVKYLDQKTNQIDTLIQKKQKQLDLLKEYRTAIINNAVIKGLNPNVKMKDSGIEWLGEIPEHWKTSHLKFLCSLLKDGTHQPPSRVDEGIPLLSVRNIVNGKFINLPDDSMISIDSYQELKRSFDVKKDDILLAIVGATLGKTAIVENMAPFFIQRSLAVFRPLENLLHFKYLFYFFQTTTFQQLLWKSVGFSAQPGIYLGSLANFTCPLPDIEEQHSIVSYLDCKIARIDALINKINKVIEKLIEYRTSLISEVITGKIDIRDKVQVPSCVPNPT